MQTEARSRRSYEERSQQKLREQAVQDYDQSQWHSCPTCGGRGNNESGGPVHTEECDLRGFKCNAAWERANTAEMVKRQVEAEAVEVNLPATTHEGKVQEAAREIEDEMEPILRSNEAQISEMQWSPQLLAKIEICTEEVLARMASYEKVSESEEVEAAVRKRMMGLLTPVDK